RREPFAYRSRVVVNDVVNAGRAALEGKNGGGSSILEMYERPDAAAIADNWKLAPPHERKLGVIGRTVERPVAEREAPRLDHHPLEVANGHQGRAHFTDR